MRMGSYWVTEPAINRLCWRCQAPAEATLWVALKADEYGAALCRDCLTLWYDLAQGLPPALCEQVPINNLDGKLQQFLYH